MEYKRKNGEKVKNKVFRDKLPEAMFVAAILDFPSISATPKPNDKIHKKCAIGSIVQ